MLRLFTRVFAVVGFLLTLLIIGGAYLIVEGMERHAPKKPDNIVLALDFDRVIVEENEVSPIAAALGQGEDQEFLDILTAIRHAAGDPNVKGVVANFGTTQPSFAMAAELRRAIQAFAAKGKFTYAYGTNYGSFGLGNRPYYLASVFQNIWMQPIGAVSLMGLSVQSPFAKTALDKIGVEADFFQREEYKSFMEMGMRDGFSDPARADMQKLIDDLTMQIATGVAEGRRADGRPWDKNYVTELMKRGPFTANEAVKEKLVDHLGYDDEIEAEVKTKAGKGAELVSAANYLSYAYADEEGDKDETEVALIRGTGLIMDKDPGPGVGGDKVMSAERVVHAFYDAVNNKKIKAIVFRIDSQGGSPEASESIRRAIIMAQQKGKKVYVSMGDVAASGGYWAAMNADRIFAEEGTITGSIGVVGGKFVIAGLLEKLGIHVEKLSTVGEGGLWSMAQKYTPTQRARMNAFMDETYKAFVERVAEARKIPLERMPDLAKGRVWSGKAAKEVGLVDEVGGYDAAVKAVRADLKMADGAMLTLVPYPAPLTPAERVMQVLKETGFGVRMMDVGALLRGALTLIDPVMGPLAARGGGVYAVGYK